MSLKVETIRKRFAYLNCSISAPTWLSRKIWPGESEHISERLSSSEGAKVDGDPNGDDHRRKQRDHQEEGQEKLEPSPVWDTRDHEDSDQRAIHGT